MFNRLKNVFSQVKKQFTSTLTGITERNKRKNKDEKTKQAAEPSKKSEEKSDIKTPEVEKPKKKSAIKAFVEDRKKTAITKQEAYRRMGIPDNLTYKVGDKSITISKIDKYLKSKGIDMTDYFLGSTKDYKYKKKTYDKQKKKFNDKILELYGREDIDDDYVDALNVMMFGNDIAFDYMKLYK